MLLLPLFTSAGRNDGPGTLSVPGYDHSVTENSADAAKLPLK